MKNRLIAVLMALAMLIVFPTSVFAENNAPGEPPSGEIGTPPEGGAPGEGGGFGGSTPPGGGTSDFEYTAATEITDVADKLDLHKINPIMPWCSGRRCTTQTTLLLC
jgi:hypothetical protein